MKREIDVKQMERIEQMEEIAQEIEARLRKELKAEGKSDKEIDHILAIFS